MINSSIYRVKVIIIGVYNLARCLSETTYSGKTHEETMKNCLIVCASFYPAFKSGGPVRSITNLIELLDTKYHFDVFTADRDLGDYKPFSAINTNSWDNKYRSSNVFYSSHNYSLIFGYKKILSKNNYDLIYLNSFFGFRFTIRFMMLFFLGLLKIKSIVLAPRGELTFGAMKISPTKKYFYLKFFKLFGLHKKITFHFTSKGEAKEALTFLGNVDYLLIPNMHDRIPPYKEKSKKENRLEIVFLSRISPKKNLKAIIKTLMLIETGDIHFTIAGVIDDQGYWSECNSLIANLPKNIKINFRGPIGREQVQKVFEKSHLFFLPTFNENYGHAIVEAMVNSNLVMLSDQTPWSDVINHGSYIGGVNDISYYVARIKRLIKMNQNEFNSLTVQTYDFCFSKLNENQRLVLQMFEEC